jgi:hypothetical protein
VDGSKTIQLKIHRLITVLKQLIKAYPNQFQDDKVVGLIHSLLHLCEPFFGPNYCAKVLVSLSETDMLMEPCSVHEITIPKDYLHEILSQDIQVLSMQMTAIDAYYFEAIRTNEWLNLKKESSLDSPRLVRTTSMWNMSTSSIHSTSTAVWESSAMDKLTERFNLVGHWVASLICSSVTPKMAAKTIERMIALANELYLLNNFHSSLAVVTGLSNPSVLRLKQSWKRVSMQCSDILIKLELLFDPSRNFSRYREALRCTSKAIPLLMLVCKDVYQVKSLEQKRTVDGLLNFERSKVLYDVLAPILRLQQQKYHFKDARISHPRSAQRNDFFVGLFHLRVLEGNQLHKKSMSIEGSLPLDL